MFARELDEVSPQLPWTVDDTNNPSTSRNFWKNYAKFENSLTQVVQLPQTYKLQSQNPNDAIFGIWDGLRT